MLNGYEHMYSGQLLNLIKQIKSIEKIEFVVKFQISLKN